jgi:hypothetical protein
VGEILDPKRLSSVFILNQNVLDFNRVGNIGKKIIFSLPVGGLVGEELIRRGEVSVISVL